MTSTAHLHHLMRVDLADVREVTALLRDLVRNGAALGWTTPPTESEVHELLDALVAAGAPDACVVVARVGSNDADSGKVPSPGQLAGFGYWRRYTRPTHRPHADLEKLAVSTQFAGRGIGRAILNELIKAATTAGIEQLTLDFRGDNMRAEQLYLSAGFREYGRLADFVAPDSNRRLDMVLHVLDARSHHRAP